MSALKNDPVYRAWKYMRRRCGDRQNKRYWGQGITVCDRWRDCRVFIADMAFSWFPGATLDRVDSGGNYSPENCRWATVQAQNTNKRNNIWFDYEGERLCLSEVARRSGVSKVTLWNRWQRGVPPPALYASRPRITWLNTELGPMRTRDAISYYEISPLKLHRLQREHGEI